MNVLVIPEDFLNDQYILKPLFTRLFQRIGVASASVHVCQNPRLRGIGEALKAERMAEIVTKYRGMMDILILCVDRDGVKGRRQRLNQLEEEFGSDVVFLAENAWEEIETWVLAGLNLPSEWNWHDVRAEVRVKKTYFEPLTRQRGLSGSRGGGRHVLGEEASRRIGAIRQKCPEDFDALGLRIEAAIGVVQSAT